MARRRTPAAPPSPPPPFPTTVAEVRVVRSLLRRVLLGDRAAWHEVSDRWGDVAYRFAVEEPTAAELDAFLARRSPDGAA